MTFADEITRSDVIDGTWLSRVLLDKPWIFFKPDGRWSCHTPVVPRRCPCEDHEVSLKQWRFVRGKRKGVVWVGQCDACGTVIWSGRWTD